MSVNQVISSGSVRGLGPEQLKGELAELTRQIVLVQVLERACGQVPDQDARRELGHLRLVAGNGPGEDVHLDAARGESLGDLDHIDVKAACVAGSRLFKRRSMNADGGYPPWLAWRHWACTSGKLQPSFSPPCSLPERAFIGDIP
jgi:hypothetical protein